MKKKKILIFCDVCKFLQNMLICIVMLSFPLLVWAQQDQVFITGSIVNNNKYTWLSSFLLTFPQGSSDYVYVNIDPYVTPTVGRFMIPVTVGQTCTVSLITTTGDFMPDHDDTLCAFNVTANSLHDATMTLTRSSNEFPVLCNYSGDPNKDTATITITNNTGINK